MDALIAANEIAASSLSIAEWTGKDHSNVCRDIRCMLVRLIPEKELRAIIPAEHWERKSVYILNNASAILDLKYPDMKDDSNLHHLNSHGFTWKLDSRGYVSEFLLGRNHALCLASSYDDRLRMAIISRLDELEQRNAGGFEIPQTLPDALRLSAELAEEKLLLEARIEEDAPKVEFYDTVTASSSVCQMAVACQVAKLSIGRNTLYRKLRSDGVLISGGKRHNLPKQRYIEQGLFTVEESKYSHPESGEPFMSFTTHVTQKGIDWLIKKYGIKAA